MLRSHPIRSTPASSLRDGLSLTALLAVALAAATPLVVNPEAYYDAFFSPKWAWIASLALIGVASLVARALLGEPMRFPVNEVWIASLASPIWCAASIAWSRSRSLAIERTLQVVALTALVWVAINVVRTRRALLNLAWIWLGVAAIVAGWTLDQDFRRAFFPESVRVVANLPDWRGYLSAGLGNTNHIGDLMALAILPALILFGEARRGIALRASAIGLVLFAAALTVCYSVGSNLGLFAGGGLMLALAVAREGARFFGRRPARWAVLAGLWALMLGFFVLDQPLNPHRPGILRQGFGSERWKEGGPTRLVIWAGGLEIVRGRPWIGGGAGNFTYLYPEAKSPFLEGSPELLKYQGLWTNAAHNIVLQAWAELGIVGVFLLAAIAALALGSLLRGILGAPRAEFLIRMPLAAMFAACLTHGMMNFVLEQPSGAVTFYLLLAATVIERRTRKAQGGMPALVLQSGSARLHVEMKTMKKATAAGLSLRPGSSRGAVAAAVVMGLALAALPALQRPVRAQSEYGRAVKARHAGSPGDEEQFLLRALELDPRAEGCRSRYSELLVERGRAEEALAQIKLVRQRLNSPELWQREARALAMLGRGEEANRAMAVYRDRVWAARGVR